MSMYDDVKGSFKCPKCGCINEDFQTKDYDCMMDTLDYKQCDYFYTSCRGCKTWLDVFIKPEIIEKIAEIRNSITHDDYIVDARDYNE